MFTSTRTPVKKILSEIPGIYFYGEFAKMFAGIYNKKLWEEKLSTWMKTDWLIYFFSVILQSKLQKLDENGRFMAKMNCLKDRIKKWERKISE